MINIVIYANCQGVIIAKILETILPKNKYKIVALYNNALSGSVLSEKLLESTLSTSDILIYQPLNDRNIFHNDRIMSFAKPLKISFPYIYNSAYQSLVNKSRERYYGEDILIQKIKKIGKDKTKIEIANGIFDFDIKKRFTSSINELKSRENQCDVHVADFIRENIRHEPMFISKNHPTFPVYRVVVDKVIILLDILAKKIPQYDYSYGALKMDLNLITPSDKMELRLEYGPSENWLGRMSDIVDSISCGSVYEETSRSFTYRTPKLDHSSMFLCAPFQIEVTESELPLDLTIDDSECKKLTSAFFAFCKGDENKSLEYTNSYLSVNKCCCTGLFLKFLMTGSEDIREQLTSNLKRRHDIQFEKTILSFAKSKYYVSGVILDFFDVVSLCNKNMSLQIILRLINNKYCKVDNELKLIYSQSYKTISLADHLKFFSDWPVISMLSGLNENDVKDNNILLDKMLCMINQGFTKLVITILNILQLKMTTSEFNELSSLLLSEKRIEGKETHKRISEFFQRRGI
ncbi:WcbI family polysaccharide biosynthesis putative acetyltransferase [Enterovibrio norvegicus]|uniref:WcbI family polysaccharide biosynthesis putative acetyltransferase n=1 Tax=Enterovibrio norvegicus TaxID=188144 RepID=UPI0010BE9814|nr:WcbI family polysaccharide biosynthesis putative acetyltransferase [Enterovibrio norvegicus]TKF30065.1 hypothetical protein FCV83_19915 [Enterovibrio norvegicus]